MIRDKLIDGTKLGDYSAAPSPKLAEISAQTDAEGAVLLKNSGMLPLRKGDKLAIFGRTQFRHQKSGTGSGGKVNVEYSTSLYESMLDSDICINRGLAELYLSWLKDNPYDIGDGWKEPWAQTEMPVSRELAEKFAQQSDKAVIIIGRTAGEDVDNAAEKGSYLLSDAEYELIKNVSAAFKKTCVLLNTGNIIDMKWSLELNISAIMYIWHGGQEGGRAAAELLCGKRFPSGHLSDTIVYDIADYPSFEGYDNTETQKYTEDIFVGYRYFETFAPERVIYPFGFGLSYTDFNISMLKSSVCGGSVCLDIQVKNVGKYTGKEVVQIYYGVAGGGISRPKKALVAFRKTNELLPGEETVLKLEFKLSDMAAYDDIGESGHVSCYVLEQGQYDIYVGTNVRNAEKVFSYSQARTEVTEKLSEVFPLREEFTRLINDNGTPKTETIPVKPAKLADAVNHCEYTGDKGIKLADVYHNKASIEEFTAQLSDFDLACLSQGEGMNSPKVHPGTGGAIGGLTPQLRSFGIPPVCVTDGPSGLRFDNGDKATCIPNGTLIACTWNCGLAEQLYMFEGAEGYANGVDALLGPGVNIHRLPLCGRNFEYMSEDPYLAGTIAAAVCMGLKNGGITATLKHFSANNKERNRKKINMIISERALREIYLKPFEIAVKGGDVFMLMTAYNMINGVFCASCSDLNTTVLRGEWGFDGLVMTDWWPNTHKAPSGDFSAAREYPIIAQNDVFMVNDSAAETANEILKAAETEPQLIAALRRNAVNILKAIIRTPSFEKSLFNNPIDIAQGISSENLKLCKEISNASGIEYVSVNAEEAGEYVCSVEFAADCADIVQLPINIFVNNKAAALCMVRGTQNNPEVKAAEIELQKGTNLLSFEHSELITVLSLKIYRKC